MMSNIFSYMIVVIVMATIYTVNCSELSSADGFDPETMDGARADKRPNFFVGSRYGRSPQKARRLTVAPRNDRFFLGSRYGKRSAENMEEVYEQDSSNQAKIFQKMTCTYSGFKNFYRCNNVSNGDINNFIDKLAKADYYSKE